MTSGGFDVVLDFLANLLVRDRACAVHGAVLFQPALDEGFQSGRLDVVVGCCHYSTSSCFASLVSTHQIFPLLESCGKHLQLASIQRVPTTDRTLQCLESRWGCAHSDIEAFTVCQQQKCNVKFGFRPRVRFPVPHRDSR